MTTNAIAARINYSNAANAQPMSRQPSIDRARGGIIKIELTIPAETIGVTGGPGRVRIPKKVAKFEIDLEMMPLINVSNYSVEMQQDGPDEMPYPNGVTNPYKGEFKA